MKRNLVKRIVAAAALAMIAAAVSACGSSNNSSVAATSCVPGQVCTVGLSGVSVNSGQPGCTVSFSGTGYVDQYLGINGQFAVTGETSGLATSATGGYTAGIINTVDGSMLELNYSGTYGYGQPLSISGVLSMGIADVGYNGCPGTISMIQLNSLAVVAQGLGQPFPASLQAMNGNNSVLLNGSYPVVSY